MAAPRPTTGAIDHICFHCAGIAEFIQRFEAAGVPFSERQAHDQALFQLFLCDPINGIKVELNFAAAEAKRAGRKPTRTAAAAQEHPAATG